MRKQFVSKARYVPHSALKLRVLVNVIRGQNVKKAIDWLTTLAVKKALPIEKMVKSAAANAKNLENVSEELLVIKDIRVDRGPSRTYFKPGAMGRSNMYKRRSCHMSVMLERLDQKEV